MAETVGEVSKFNFCFEWKVRDFLLRPENSGEFCTSPEFLLDGNPWVLQLYPNGGTNSPGWMSLYLIRRTTTGNKFLRFKLAMIKSDGSLYARFSEHLFDARESSWGWLQFVQKSEILSKRNLMTPGNVLTISCTISWERDASKRVQQSNGGPSKRPKILWESLGRNLKDLFLSHRNSDAVIRVRNKEFPVHRAILSARSTVFAAMFEYDMTEKLTGIVEISDVNPDVFRDLLIFMYSGELKTLSSENVYDIYALSDKYDLKDLKDECASFMECRLSVETVCDVLLLSEKYSGDDLKASAKDYFAKHAADIMARDQWKTFESEYCVLVMELLKSAVSRKGSQ